MKYSRIVMKWVIIKERLKYDRGKENLSLCNLSVDSLKTDKGGFLRCEWLKLGGQVSSNHWFILINILLSIKLFMLFAIFY